MLRRAVFGASLAGLAACSLFTDLGGFTNPPDGIDGADPDATANGDGDSADGSAPPNDADSGATLQCTANASTICESFDVPTGLPSDWGPVVARGAVQVEARRDAPSPPNALRASISDSPDDTAFAQLLRTVPVTPLETITLEQDLFIDAIGTTYANLTTLDLRTDQGALYSLQLSHQNGEAFIEEYSKLPAAPAHSFLTPRTTAITLGQWHRVVMSLTKTLPRSYSLIIDGTTIYTGPVKAEAPPEALANGKIRVALGIAYQGKGPAITTFTDNVKLTWK